MLLFSLVLQTQVQAAAPTTTIYVNGVKLVTDQAPITVGSRILLPLRAIFEVLDSTVDWNAKAKTVTATKDDTTIVLKLGSKTATINNEAVMLDVAAQSINGRTMIPVRFVSEAMGAEVDWNAGSKSVFIKTSGEVSPVPNVYAQVVGHKGNGSDLVVSFIKSPNESTIDHYRILIVKAANVPSFHLAAAQAVTSKNYTTALTQSGDQTISLSAQSRDVNGELIRADQSYAAFVLAVGKANGQNALSQPSSKVTITVNAVAPAVTNVKTSDINDYGDGRDLQFSFTKASDESKISAYRVFVVKTANAGTFNLAKANATASSNYTLVNKTGSSITQTLASGTRDVDGAAIVSGMSYQVFVLSAASNNNSGNNTLSEGSAPIVLSTNTGNAAANNVVAFDVSDYNDARDLRVNFNKASDEGRISQYRIFVVKAAYADSFTLTTANALPSSFYTVANKTGNNISQALASSAKDTSGDKIKNGVSYSIFVVSVGANRLSAPSPNVVLTNSSSLLAATDVKASDSSDYNDARDMLVTFNKAYDETNISHYRVLIVKAANAGSFTLGKANEVASSNYTALNKTGGNLSLNLASGSRDVDGTKISDGVSYRVFILSVGGGSYNGNNALSAPSGEVVLTDSISAATNVSAKITDSGRIDINFDKPHNQTGISYYAVMIVPAGVPFDVKAANNAAYFIQVNGGTGTTTNDNDKDITGAPLNRGSSYKVYVLSVAANGNTSSNALSDPSGTVTL